MRNIWFLKLVMAVIVVVLLGVATPLVGADSGGSVWYLSSEDKPSGVATADDGKTHTVDNLMQQGSMAGLGSYFTLPVNEIALFYADAGADVDLSFGENSWQAFIRTEGISGDEIGEVLSVEICKLEKNTGEITVLASGSEALAAAASKTLWEISCQDNAATLQSFAVGDWLALRLSWTDVDDPLRIYYKAESGSESYIWAPSADPGYPTPEMPTAALIGIGVMLLGGGLWFKRRRALAVHAGR